MPAESSLTRLWRSARRAARVTSRPLLAQALALLFLSSYSAAKGGEPLNSAGCPSDAAQLYGSTDPVHIACLALPFAGLSRGIYDYDPVACSDPNRSGFCAGTDAKNPCIVVFRGTNDGLPIINEDDLDWAANFGQYFGTYVGPYMEALRHTEKTMAECKGNVIVTGHSLGGGMAQFVANRHGLTAYAFNSAGLVTPMKVSAIGIPLVTSRIALQTIQVETIQAQLFAEEGVLKLMWKRANPQAPKTLVGLEKQSASVQGLRDSLIEEKSRLEVFKKHLLDLEGYRDALQTRNPANIIHLVSNDDPVSASGRLLGLTVVYQANTGHFIKPFEDYLAAIIGGTRQAKADFRDCSDGMAKGKGIELAATKAALWGINTASQKVGLPAGRVSAVLTGPAMTSSAFWAWQKITNALTAKADQKKKDENKNVQETVESAWKKGKSVGPKTTFGRSGENSPKQNEPESPPPPPATCTASAKQLVEGNDPCP